MKVKIESIEQTVFSIANECECGVEVEISPELKARIERADRDFVQLQQMLAAVYREGLKKRKENPRPREISPMFALYG